MDSNRETQEDRVMRNDKLISRAPPVRTVEAIDESPRRLGGQEETVYSFEPLVEREENVAGSADSPQKAKISRETWNMSSDPSWNREVVDTSGPRTTRSQAKLQSHTARVKSDGSMLNFTRGEKYKAPYKAVSNSAVVKMKEFAEVGQIDGETSAEWYNRLVTLTKDIKDIDDPEGDDDEESFLSAYRISVGKALKDKDETRRKSALAAMDMELDGLMGLHLVMQ